MNQLLAKLKKIGLEKHYWQRESRLLLAVSGGVDSMVLLHLMQQLQGEIGFHLGVAHVNHQLREASLIEESYLQEYCLTAQLPFYTTRWQKPQAVGTEAAARDFRYQFFTEVMATEGFDTLLTAHHQEDQVETFLMKTMRGGDFKSHQGILPVRDFASGRLIRPLLSFSKKELQAFALTYEIQYFEDESNFSDDYQRNRVRHHILPQLAKENTESLQHIADFSQQVNWAQEIINQQMAKLYQQMVSVADNGYQVVVADVQALTAGEKYYFWEYFFQKTLLAEGVGSKQRQLKQLLRLLASDTSQWQMDFENQWQLLREYQNLYFLKKKPSQQSEFKLADSIYLSENEWVGIFPATEKVRVPAEVADWQTFTGSFKAEKSAIFSIRHRKDGDKIALSPQLTKRLSRYFIDKKITTRERDAAWVLVNQTEQVLALLPYVFANLSIAAETDTILYTLIYKFK
ncbi:tRNA(Ile)-lysidine synthase [Enterococcus sp. PF1-24]|uniref:tRNA lysidine(34) synthetase TilS n=1 Tax=unclassified Enterococcus TaxID=2608891 RepID=UPI00247304F2|nr:MULTISPECIES: tRNA lysidine(34) synthetase TilS [unclassified Enterococcus]MDH6363919.1 tRNA(Ile)-lysidine synthase [Enterococcus sp. PFB1-1]MDH6401020.1 tRNA(Ile)-lysidine synthase [Enterococcus sp. PF1-24]